jgi:hypothetical protein
MEDFSGCTDFREERKLVNNEKATSPFGSVGMNTVESTDTK